MPKSIYSIFYFKNALFKKYLGYFWKMNCGQDISVYIYIKEWTEQKIKAKKRLRSVWSEFNFSKKLWSNFVFDDGRRSEISALDESSPISEYGLRSKLGHFNGKGLLLGMLKCISLLHNSHMSQILLLGLEVECYLRVRWPNFYYH